MQIPSGVSYAQGAAPNKTYLGNKTYMVHINANLSAAKDPDHDI